MSGKCLNRIAAEVELCARSWESNACLMGNVKARQIVELMEERNVLLAACKAALDHLDGCSHGYPDELWDEIEKVITRAEGEQ